MINRSSDFLPRPGVELVATLACLANLVADSYIPNFLSRFSVDAFLPCLWVLNLLAGRGVQDLKASLATGEHRSRQHETPDQRLRRELGTSR